MNEPTQQTINKLISLITPHTQEVREKIFSHYGVDVTSFTVQQLALVCDNSWVLYEWLHSLPLSSDFSNINHHNTESEQVSLLNCVQKLNSVHTLSPLITAARVVRDSQWEEWVVRTYITNSEGQRTLYRPAEYYTSDFSDACDTLRSILGLEKSQGVIRDKLYHRISAE